MRLPGPFGLRVLGLLVLAAAAWPAWTQAPAAELKAQVLVKALRFVEWPASALAPGQALLICLTEDGALAQELLKADGQALADRPLQVRLMSRGARLPAACHVAVMGATATATTLNAGTLLVAEEPTALGRGAMLGLAIEDGRVVFDVDLESARRAGIGFSARLLRLARYVRKD